MSPLLHAAIGALTAAGPMLLLGATVLLALGSAGVLLARAPIHRQRLAEVTVAAVLLWIALALAPLPRIPLTGWFGKQPQANVAVEDRDAGARLRRTPSHSAGRRDGWEPPAVREQPAQRNAETAAEVEEPVALVQNAAADSPADPPRQSISATPAWRSEAFAIAFVAGVIVCGAWLILGRILLARLLWRTRPPDPWLQRLYASLPFAGRRRPTLRVASRRANAFSCGLIQPTIVVSHDLCRPAEAESLRHVLLHELVHAAQRDAWGRLLLNLALPLLFFHPLYWWLRGQISLAAELVADDWAARQTSPAGYAEALVALMRRRRMPVLGGFGLVGVFATRSQFARRMELLLSRETRLATRCSRRWLASCVVLASSAVVLAAGILGTTPPGAIAEDSGEPTSAELRQAERDLIDAEIRVLHLRAAADQAKTQQRLIELRAKRLLLDANDPTTRLGALVAAAPPDDAALVAEMFAKAVARPPTAEERKTALAQLAAAADRRKAIGDLIYALAVSREGQRAMETEARGRDVSDATILGRPGDWPQWGGSSTRNNTPGDAAIPATFDPAGGKHVKWSIPAGDQTTSTPVVAGDKVFVGANNGAGYLERYPKEVDLGTLLCFRASDGKFLWQHSSEKLATGRIHDWPTLGVCSSPCVEGDRLWFFTNRGEVLCLDTEGFLDGENDGPVTDEPNENRDEADIVWRLDMMRELGVVPLQKFCCSPTTFGDLLFVNTSNSLREDHLTPANPQAPSFLALDKRSGRVVWSDNSPGEMVLGIGVGSPAVGVLGGVPQVIFPGNDGWLYSFRADEGNDGKPQPLWKFDCNPKTSQWMHGGRGTRNNLITTPVIHDGLVYIAGGRNPEHGEGPGRLWCIDPTRRGDVSSELAVKASDHSQLLPRRRLQAVDESKDEAAIANPNSAAVWHFAQFDLDGDGKIAFEEQMHRSASNATIKDGLLLVTDISGLVHCLDAKTGRLHWTHDLFAACWGTPLIVDGKVIVGDEDGDVTVLRLSDTLEVLGETTVDTSVYATPIVAGGVLYIASRTRLYAITADE